MEKFNDEYEHYEKMFQSLVVAFDWVLGKDYLKSEIIKKSILVDYGINIDRETGDEVEEVIATSRADTIGEIYTYSAENDLPTHLIDEAYDEAFNES